MELGVQATGIAQEVVLVIFSPERSRSGAAVGANKLLLGRVSSDLDLVSSSLAQRPVKRSGGFAPRRTWRTRHGLVLTGGKGGPISDMAAQGPIVGRGLWR